MAENLFIIKKLASPCDLFYFRVANYNRYVWLNTDLEQWSVRFQILDYWSLFGFITISQPTRKTFSLKFNLCDIKISVCKYLFSLWASKSTCVHVTLGIYLTYVQSHSLILLLLSRVMFKHQAPERKSRNPI